MQWIVVDNQTDSIDDVTPGVVAACCQEWDRKCCERRVESRDDANVFCATPFACCCSVCHVPAHGDDKASRTD